MKSPASVLWVFGILFACSLALIAAYLRSMSSNRTLHVLQRQARFTLFVFGVTLVDYAFLTFVVGLPWAPSLGIISRRGDFGHVSEGCPWRSRLKYKIVSGACVSTQGK